MENGNGAGLQDRPQAFPAWQHAVVFRLGLIDVSTLRNLIGELVAPDIQGSHWSFFVDSDPDANWTHPCGYIFIDPSNASVKWRLAGWPPADDVAMVYLRQDQGA